MKLEPEGETSSRYKRKIRMFFGLFILLMIALTLFSNTLMALTLPKIVVTTSGSGKLTHTFQGSGMVKWRAEAALTGTAGGKVEKVHVKEGQLVKKGQVLVVYDQDNLKHQIQDEQASLSKLKLTIEELQYSYKEAIKSGDEKTTESAGRVLKLNEIDRDMQQRKIKKLQKEYDENDELIAPFDGVITKVNVMEGLGSVGGEPEMIISNRSLGFEFEFAAPSSLIGEMEVGSRLTVQIKGSNARQADGTIAQIKDVAPVSQRSSDESEAAFTAMKQLVVSLKDEALQAGEQAETQIIKTLDDVILIPNKAIHKEGEQAYVYSIEERNGPLGNDFYVRKINISIIDSNEHQSAVEGVFEDQQIILESSDPLQEGDKVRMQ